MALSFLPFLLENFLFCRKGQLWLELQSSDPYRYVEKQNIPKAADEAEELGSSEKGVELGFGLRNEKASLMEKERSGGVVLGLGQK